MLAIVVPLCPRVVSFLLASHLCSVWFETCGFVLAFVVPFFFVLLSCSSFFVLRLRSSNHVCSNCVFFLLRSSFILFNSICVLALVPSFRSSSFVDVVVSRMSLTFRSPLSSFFFFFWCSIFHFRVACHKLVFAFFCMTRNAASLPHSTPDHNTTPVHVRRNRSPEIKSEIGKALGAVCDVVY